jgi:uncharacterized protein YciI
VTKTTTIALLLILGILTAGVTLGQNQPSKAEEKEFVYRIQPIRVEMLRNGPTQEEAAIVNEHFNYLKGLTAKGVVILAGRTLTSDESTFGIVIFRAASEQAGREVMNGDPAVKKGVMRAALFPFKVVLIEPRKRE